eukprot:3359349-Pleurochrysis_carterae.AAC.1
MNARCAHASLASDSLSRLLSPSPPPLMPADRLQASQHLFGRTQARSLAHAHACMQAQNA